MVEVAPCSLCTSLSIKALAWQPWCCGNPATSSALAWLFGSPLYWNSRHHSYWFFFKQNVQRKHVFGYRIPHSVIFFHSSFKSTIKYKMRYDYNYTIPPPASPTSFSTHTLSTFIYFVVLGNNTQSLICSLDQRPFTGPIKTYQQTHPQITWLSLFHICP